ncbi:MAG TPA: plastocyanin/azurin family copper-binding protein [Solirubrobacterales bacterium]|jgi:plastocyanin|nr:plastocyanin/azurin family copper-binding protein [Solirubrobacterales bacterium]
MKKLALTFGLAAVASLALVACGGSSSSTSTPTTTAASSGGGGGSSSGGGGASSSVSLAADPSQIAYDTTSLSAKAGNVTIDFNNPNSALGHDVCVQDPNGKKLGCSQVVTGGKTTLDLSNLKSGSYTFYCSVDSHEAAGMKGTLTVQ